MHSIARLSILNIDRNHFSDHTAHGAVSFLDQGALVTFEGRYRDLEMQERIDTTVEAYLEMAGQKTGSLYGTTLSIAAKLSNLDEKVCGNIFRSGHFIGQARQIKLDITLLQINWRELYYFFQIIKVLMFPQLIKLVVLLVKNYH